MAWREEAGVEVVAVGGALVFGFALSACVENDPIGSFDAIAAFIAIPSWMDIGPFPREMSERRLFRMAIKIQNFLHEGRVNKLNYVCISIRNDVFIMIGTGIRAWT